MHPINILVDLNMFYCIYICLYKNLISDIMLNSQIFQMSIKQFKLLYSMHRSKNFFQKGVGWYDRGIMLFAKVRVGKEVQGLYFGYFYWVSLKDFGGGGTPNLIAQFKYDSLPTSSALYQRRQISFDLPLLKKKAEELSFITIFYKKEQRKITC